MPYEETDWLSSVHVDTYIWHAPYLCIYKYWMCWYIMVMIYYVLYIYIIQKYYDFYPATCPLFWLVLCVLAKEHSHSISLFMKKSSQDRTAWLLVGWTACPSNLPLGNLTYLLKIAISSWFTHEKCWFSIVMCLPDGNYLVKSIVDPLFPVDFLLNLHHLHPFLYGWYPMTFLCFQMASPPKSPAINVVNFNPLLYVSYCFSLAT